MKKQGKYFCFLGALIMASTTIAADLDVKALEKQVRDAESAFAKTMADRDFAAFSAFISEEAVFLSGSTARRGRDEIAAHWQQYYLDPEAPFSWKPETVAILQSGMLALSTGPVFDPAGNLIARFSSTWRQESPGVWRVIFDKGEQACKPGQ